MYSKALPWLIRLGRPDTIRYIIDNGLFVDAQSHVLALVRLDASTDRAGGLAPSVQMLVDHVQAIPVRQKRPEASDASGRTRRTSAAGRTGNSDRVPSRALRPGTASRCALWRSTGACEACVSSLTAQIDLLAEHLPRRLMDFLRASSYYDVRHVRSAIVWHD